MSCQRQERAASAMARALSLLRFAREAASSPSFYAMPRQPFLLLSRRFVSFELFLSKFSSCRAPVIRELPPLSPPCFARWFAPRGGMLESGALPPEAQRSRTQYAQARAAAQALMLLSYSAAARSSDMIA